MPNSINDKKRPPANQSARHPKLHAFTNIRAPPVRIPVLKVSIAMIAAA